MQATRPDKAKEPSLRQRKAASFLKRKIASILRDEGIEGLDGLVTITQVDISPDFKEASVWVSVLGQDPQVALSALQRDVYRMQGLIMNNATMKVVPRIRFKKDESSEYSARISTLLQNL
jgi:ribosome-binding factor A